MQTINKASALRATRIAAVTAAVMQQRVAAKHARFAAATQAHNQGAYLLAVQQLAAQYGVAAPTTLSVRSVPHTQQHAPSAVQGACAIVRGLVAANPSATRKQILALAHAQGINPATAATQYAVAKRAQ